MRRRAARILASWLAAPAREVLQGLERCLDRPAPASATASFARVGLGLLLGWWLYVPAHELLHALGCWAAGGEVERLEIAALYGGAILARWLPFVVAGGEYAGRLSGFDTAGSDAVYLATDLAPFLLTVFPGVWLLRRAAARRRAVLWGASLPLALAPFLSLPGDAYEIGSIVTTRLPPWRAHLETLRGDDVGRIAGELGHLAAAPWGGLVSSALLGGLWAYLVYGLGAVVAGQLGEEPTGASAQRLDGETCTSMPSGSSK